MSMKTSNYYIGLYMRAMLVTAK